MDADAMAGTNRSIGQPPAASVTAGGAARGLTVGLIAAVVVLDQVAKFLVNQTLPPQASIEIIPGFVNLTHVRNTGAAFGMLNAADFPFKPAVMSGVAAVALLAITLYALRVASHGAVARVGLALILGGAVGNLIDRVSAGYVIDFVDVHWRTYHFWAFNVADSSITIGAACLILDMLSLRRNASNTL